MRSPAPSTGRSIGFLSLTVAGALWGTPFVFAKWVQGEVSVGQLMLLRFVFASLALTPALWFERTASRLQINRADWPLFFWCATLGVPVQFLVQFGGLARTTISHASLMVGLLPAILAVGAALFANERLGRVQIGAIALSTVGAAFVAFGSAGDGARGATFTGDAMVTLSLFGGASWVLLSQRLMQRGYSPIATSAVVVLIGTTLLAAWILLTEGAPPLGHLSWHAWVAVVSMGVIATATTTVLWNWGVSRVPASQAGVFVNLEPVVGTTLGVALFHDHIGVAGIVGGLLIVGAAIVVMRE